MDAPLPAQLEWGLPDWRDEEAYPDPERDDLTLSQWRWEFLRRSPQYRADWERFVRGKHNLALWPMAGDAKTAQQRSEERAWEQYGIPNFVDPRLAAPPDFWFRAAVCELFEGEHYTTDRHALIQFDVSLPLEPQIEGISRWLETRQRGVMGRLIERRKSMDKWALYLRVLDARDSEPRPTYAEIAETLSRRKEPGHDASPDEMSDYANWHERRRTIGKKWYEQACRIRDAFPYEDVPFNASIWRELTDQ